MKLLQFPNKIYVLKGSVGLDFAFFITSGWQLYAVGDFPGSTEVPTIQLSGII
jgi:hypothetical protein